MTTEIQFPGLVWVKDPVNATTGDLTGERPRRRHHEDCWHWYRDEQGGLLGPPPYPASDEQMRELPHCKTCAADFTERTASTSVGAAVASSRTGTCETCGMTRSASGSCYCDD
ncbi:hypothetical protein [Promicromonospora aerolata]|uniref:Uncharacterized protein n=1 Tax=Promicromonospora aerolata TaxID=195749 RepID=A0ABW4V8R9_9MICO